MTSREPDLCAVTRLVSEASGDNLDPGEPLPWSVLDGLKALLSCDVVSFFQLDSAAQQVPMSQEVPTDPAKGDPGGTQPPLEVFFRHYWDSELCCYPDRTGDLHRVLGPSDFYTPRQYRSTGMWSEYLRPAGIAHELVACLGGKPGQTLRMVLARGPGPDFSERDRAVVWLLRPHLLRLYRDRRAGAQTAGLTPRQRELMLLLAAGGTNRQIGRRLGVSESTVRKHLEHIFERLQVTGRAAAVTRAFPHGTPEL